MWLVDGPGGRANAASQYATCAICGLTGSFIQQIVPNVFAYLRLKKHVSNSNSCESLIYMNKERGLAKKVVWYDHSHDTRNLLYGFPHCAIRAAELLGTVWIRTMEAGSVSGTDSLEHSRKKNKTRTLSTVLSTSLSSSTSSDISCSTSLSSQTRPALEWPRLWTTHSGGA